MVWYATREAVKDSLEINRTAFANHLIDSKLSAATNSIHAQLHRKFYPEIRTQTFDWPNHQYAPTWTLYLEQHELISLDTLQSGSTEISSSAYLLRPDDGPPYTRIELDLNSSAAFGGGNTWQRDISVAGLFGYRDERQIAGILETSINASVTVVDLEPSNSVLNAGVGSIFVMDSERMIATNRRMIDTTVNTGSAMTASMNDNTVSVADGTLFAYDENLLIDSERMRIVDIAGNSLIVKRAWDGTALAAHDTASDIYANRRFIVERGVLGTTASSHDALDSVEVQQFPGLVTELAIAEAVVSLEQTSSAYARTLGSGDNAREAAGLGLADVRAEAVRAFGRKSRKKAV